MINSNAVKVRAADFNGQSFDGCPFDHVPDWLVEAEKDGKVSGENPGSTDYLVWRVTTPNGDKMAEPGDSIVLLNGELHVMDSDEYVMRFFV